MDVGKLSANGQTYRIAFFICKVRHKRNTLQRVDESIPSIYKEWAEWLSEAYAYVDTVPNDYDFTLLATLIGNYFDVQKEQNIAPDVQRFVSFMKKIRVKKIHRLRLICMLSGLISCELVERLSRGEVLLAI